MGDLTLDQVKKAGRFAWIESCRELDYMTTDGRTFRNDSILYGSVAPDEELPVSGWNHLPDCDCEFCRG